MTIKSETSAKGGFQERVYNRLDRIHMYLYYNRFDIQWNVVMYIFITMVMAIIMAALLMVNYMVCTSPVLEPNDDYRIASVMARSDRFIMPVYLDVDEQMEEDLLEVIGESRKRYSFVANMKTHYMYDVDVYVAMQNLKTGKVRVMRLGYYDGIMYDEDNETIFNIADKRNVRKKIIEIIGIRDPEFQA